MGVGGGNHMLKEVFQIIHNSKNWEETYISNSRELIKLWSEAIWVSIPVLQYSESWGDTL